MAESASSVAILGAGPSGLAACKAALEEGLRPRVFEQAAGVGGLWRGDGFGKVWNSLRTNLSKFTCAFSDTPWEEAAPDFPSCVDVQKYLEAYSSKYSIPSYLTQNVRVISLEPLDAGGWRVTWEEFSGMQSRTSSERFDFVVVATGIFSKPKLAPVPGSANFTGELLHTASYREPTRFRDRRVLVVGSAFSGADVAADIAGHAKSVTIAARRPLWYLPRYIGGKPADLAFYSRAASDKSRGKTAEELNLGRHAFFASLVGELPSTLRTPDPRAGDLPYVAITDQFLDSVRAGHISVRPTDVLDFEGQTVVFADGHREEFDTVIMATGYTLDLPFFSSQVLEVLEFDAEDLLQPVILHDCVWRPELPRLAFVGVYRGPYFAAMELQARWACGVFSGRLPEPSEEEVLAGLEKERSVRTQRPRPQFPHGDYVGMTEALACRVGVHPKEILADASHPLQSLLYDGPLLPFHYRLVGFGAAAAVAEAAIKECAAKYPVAAL